jgi:hypothetical protein
MPGLSSSDRSTYGIQVTHLSDDNHVRVMAQGVNQGGGERFGVITQIPLSDKTFLIRENVFNRVFDSYDIAMLVLIEVVYHGR